MILTIIKSLVITLLISIGVAFSFKNIFGFWETFTLVTIAQYFVSIAVTSYEEKRGKIAELVATLDEIIERQTVIVECPCGKGKSSVAVFNDEDTVVQCNICSNKFRVITEISTRLLTEPLELEKMYDKLNEH